MHTSEVKGWDGVERGDDGVLGRGGGGSNPASVSSSTKWDRAGQSAKTEVVNEPYSWNARPSTAGDHTSTLPQIIIDYHVSSIIKDAV